MKHETMPDVVVKLMAGRERVAKGLCQGYFSIERPECFGGDLECPITAVEGNLAAMAYLSAALPPGFCSVIIYTDAKGRTLAHILALFDRAIAAALAAPQ